MTTMTRWLQRLHHQDLQVLLWLMASPRHGGWAQGARLVSRTGDGILQLLLPLLAWLADPIDGKRFCIAVAVGFAIERPLYWVLKNSCQRRRPPEAIPSFCSVIRASDRFSFPSGHTAAAFLLATLFTACYGVLALPLFLWAACVGASRVVLGVHFPTDTLAGAALGVSIASVTVTSMAL